MKNKFITAVFQTGAILVLIGSATYIISLIFAPYMYLIGSLMVAVAQILSPIRTDSKVIKRLHVQQILGGIFLFISAVCMFLLHHNEWILCLAIACVFEGYSIFRISYELKKEQ